MIVFEDTSNRYLDSEDWRYNDKLNKKAKVSTRRSPKVDTEFALLDWNESKLIKEFNRLEKSRHYRILATRRWKQTGLDRNQAFDIPINIPEEEAEINNTLTETTDQENAQQKVETAVIEEAEIEQQTDSPEPTAPYVTGHVKLIMSRYLHFNVDLKYIRPQPQTAETDEQIILTDETNDEMDGFNQPHTLDNAEQNESLLFSVPIVNERRMRSREIHYIDHPLVGIIVLATPYKIEPPETEPAELPAPYKTM